MKPRGRRRTDFGRRLPSWNGMTTANAAMWRMGASTASRPWTLLNEIIKEAIARNMLWAEGCV